MGLREDILADPACADALAARDCVELARIMSVGRIKLITKMITERGVRAALSITAGSQFIRMLKDASETVGVPAWLAATLTTIGLPETEHQDYADALASAYGWLRQDAGIDLSVAATRAMLDLIAASDPVMYGATITTLKALADHADPLTAQDVAEAVFNPDGSLK